MTLDPKLLEILACPEDKGPLLYFEDAEFLYNDRLRRRYLIKENIPIMLIDESEAVTEDEHGKLMEQASSEGISPTFEL
ncbi:MAG: Uncharacterised protein [Acidimicrobiales bacterium AG-410-I20]|nr:MAG: Uncharacterised protein [Acidimicrobiales bacterium AG-410-I20]